MSPTRRRAASRRCRKRRRRCSSRAARISITTQKNHPDLRVLPTAWSQGDYSLYMRQSLDWLEKALDEEIITKIGGNQFEQHVRSEYYGISDADSFRRRLDFLPRSLHRSTGCVLDGTAPLRSP